MRVCFCSPINVNPHCAVGGWLAAVWPRHRSGEGGFLYFVTSAELACFRHFCRHLLTNPVRYLRVCLQNGILRCRPSKSSVISWFMSEFQAFGSSYLSEFAKRWPLKFSLEQGRSPCSSHCGRSKCRGVAVQAYFSKQPRDRTESQISKTSLLGRFRFLTQTGLTLKNPAALHDLAMSNKLSKTQPEKYSGVIKFLRTLEKVYKFVKWSELHKLSPKAFRAVFFTPKP